MFTWVAIVSNVTAGTFSRPVSANCHKSIRMPISRPLLGLAMVSFNSGGRTRYQESENSYAQTMLTALIIIISIFSSG